MKVFLKNYITVGLLPPVGGENAGKEAGSGESPPAGGKNTGENAGWEDRAERPETSRSAQKRTTRRGPQATPEQSLFHIFPDFSKILFLETLTGYPDASDA